PSWRQQLLSVLLAAAGVELYLLAALAAALALVGTGSWAEVFALGGAAAACLGLGALGLGVLAVEGPPREHPRGAAVETYLGNGLETLASAAVNLASGLLRTGVVAALAGLTWFTACESLSWWGGARVQWVRWGLDGRLAPVVEGGLAQVASW